MKYKDKIITAVGEGKMLLGAWDKFTEEERKEKLENLIWAVDQMSDLRAMAAMVVSWEKPSTEIAEQFES